MPYTPPAQRSPAASADNTPSVSRRSSYHQSIVSPTVSNRPELPRSTSYLTRHRRTPSVKTAKFAPTFEPSPPGTTDNHEHGEKKSLASSNSVRQSPPPVTDESKLPVGAVISPPDSMQNSSDDEDPKNDRGRHLENLAELQAAIRIIEQNRESSPNRTSENGVAKHGPALTLEMPNGSNVETPVPVKVDTSTAQTLRKIVHNRSSTDTSIFLDLRQTHSPEESSITASEEDGSDDDEPERSRRKPPMLRKKSGELVRPALRPSSSRRRPSSMPGTPTFSKAVHFDSHLEHVRHFLQVDRPLAVSAGSSPVEAYDSDTEFPFNDDTTIARGPPFDWEIVVSNFPVETPASLALPVRVERVFLSADNKTLVGTIAVANLAFNKYVVARFTLDYWKTTSEVVAEYNNDVRQPKHADGCDRFNFNIKLADQANLEAKTMFFCVKYCVNGQEYWDNNNFTNYQIDFRKKAKPQNGKKGMQGAASRPANALPRSQKKSSPHGRPKSMPATFDDFADGFDAKYQFADFKQPVDDLLSDSNTAVRLKGVKSAVNLGSDALNRKGANPNGQAFGHRYDFGASLTAAIQAANSVMGDRSGITMKPPVKKPGAKPASIPIATPLSIPASKQVVPVPAPIAAVTADTTKGTNSPRPAGSEKPVLASQSYNELLDKYCFFGSSKNSPQVKEGTLRSGQYDGTNDDDYLGSAISTAESSPLMKEKKSSPASSRSQITQASRSASPAPMTGFVTGTSPMYPHNMHTGFSFRDAHTPTAIRG